MKTSSLRTGTRTFETEDGEDISKCIFKLHLHRALDWFITIPLSALISLNHGSFVSEVGKAAQRADELGIT